MNNTISSRVNTSEAFKGRVDSAFHRLLVSALGMVPEDSSDRFAATSGELRHYLAESDPDDAGRDR